MKLLSFEVYIIGLTAIEPELKYKNPWTVVFK